MLATVPQLLMALVLAQLLNQRLRARTLWRMGVLLPNITSVAAVGIIFTLLFARDFGLVNWLLGHVGVDPIDWQQHRWSSWLAISTMVDWRWTGYNALIFLAALQAVPADLYEAAEIDGASPVKQFWHITVPMLRPTIIFVSLISTIGGIQLFTEPLLFNSGANAITGGTTRQFQTLTMYVYEKAFTGQEFGYAASDRLGDVPGDRASSRCINALLLRRLRGVDMTDPARARSSRSLADAARPAPAAARRRRRRRRVSPRRRGARRSSPRCRRSRSTSWW